MQTYTEKKGKTMTEKDSRTDRAAAERYLEGCGAEVLDVGYTCEAGCADVVFREDDELVFAEVKSKDGTSLPEERISRALRSRMETVAACYLKDHNAPSCAVRFDVISMAKLGKGQVLLRHHRGAFSAPALTDTERSKDAARPRQQGKAQPKADGPKARASVGRER
jgi:Holliday junction resolvase-like predicted endonuclease